MRNGAVEPMEVTDLVTDLQALAARLDPDAIADTDVAGVIDDLGRALRLVQGMTTLMARRLAETTAGQPSGPATAAATLARATGTTPAAARTTLQTSRRLHEQPDVATAVRQGALSHTQADAVTDAAAADPAATNDLLKAAASQTVADLKRTCRDTRAAADGDRDATRQRHHRRRTCRSWSESDGEWKTILTGPADYGARFQAALRREHDDIFRTAHAAGRHEPDAAYRLDALLAVMERGATITPDPTSDQPSQAEQPDGQAADHPTDPAADQQPADATRSRTRQRRRSGRQTTVIITVDAAALRRDRLAPGDVCHIDGIGPVSLTAVKQLIPDAHLAYVIRDGTDVSVAHLGRQASAHQRTALHARGYECEVPHCRASHLLEIDHVRDWAFSKQTILEELAWLCPAHHHEKTSRGHRLTGPPGHRHWQDASGHTISSDPDPPDTNSTHANPTNANPTNANLFDANLFDPGSAVAAATDLTATDAGPTARMPLDRVLLKEWSDRLPDRSPVIASACGHHVLGDANRGHPRRSDQIRRRRILRHAGWPPADEADGRRAATRASRSAEP